MSLAALLSAAAALLCSLMSMICGSWLQAGNSGSLSFHTTCGIASVVLCALCFLLLWQERRGKKKEG